MSEQLVADIQATRTLLQNRGWCQYIPEDEDGRMCLVAALNRAVVSGPNGYANYHPIRTLMMNILGSKWATPVEYNNAKGRTFKQVLALLDKTEAAARNQ